MARSQKRKQKNEAESGTASAVRREQKKAGAHRRIGKEAREGKGSKRFILIIGDEGAILVFMQGAKVIRRLFAPSPQPSHTEAIVEIISSNPSVPIFVLGDVLDQQYVPHTFPPVSSLSVGGLIKRRLDRDFAPEDLKGSLPLGRDKTGRKEWKFLLVALSKTPLLSEWIEQLIELPNELKGIYLVPVESVNYINMLRRRLSDGQASSWQLLISHNKVSGFRQVVVHDGKLVFTRVSQAIDDAIPAVIAGNIEQEIISTIEYLKRLEFRDGSDLDATIIVSQDVLETLDLKRFAFANANALTPMQVAEFLELEQAALSADRFGDVVMAAAFGINKKRVLRFSNAYINRLANVYKAIVGVRYAAFAVAAMLLLAAAGEGLSILQNYSEIAKLQNDAVSLQSSLKTVRDKVNSLNQDVAYKAAVVATYDAYMKDLPQPQGFVVQLSPLLTPQQRIVKFDWRMEDVKSAGAAAPKQLPVKVRLEVDFSGAGTTLEKVDKAATQFDASIKQALPAYEISNEPFPWVKDQAQSPEMEINAASATNVTNAIATFTLLGVKNTAGGPSAPSKGASVP